MIPLTTESIDQFRKSIVVQGGSENTARAYAADLRGFRSHCPAAAALSEDTLGLSMAHYLTMFRDTWAPATTARKLTAFRTWAKWAGLAPSFLATYRAPTAAPGVPHPLPGGLSDLKAMIDVSRTPTERALVALCGLCGLRVGESLRITPESVVIREEAMQLHVIGKGMKHRYVPLSVPAIQAITSAYGPVMTDPIISVSERKARYMVTDIGRRALGRQVASHDLRMTFGTLAYEQSGYDIRVVADLLGHSDTKTTMRYIGVNTAKKSNAVNFME